MRRKSIAFLVTLIMVLSLVIPQVSVLAADTGISVQFNNGNAAANSNQITARFKVTNNTSSALNLADLTLKYFYTKDSSVPQTFWCDHSGMMNGWNYIDVTSKVKGSFVDYKAKNTDTYLLVKFDSNAGSLPAGGSIEVQTRVARNDWTNYNQSNDWSYKQLGSYGDNQNVCAYRNGTKVFGIEPPPDGQLDPTINPTTSRFTQGAASNLVVTLTPNGNTFKNITGLTQGTDYTVSGTTVTILQSYLNNLVAGSKALTFDFGVANNPVLNLTIDPPSLNPTINPTSYNIPVAGTVTSDLSVTLTPNGYTFKGITGLTQGTDYTVSGNTVAISKNYLNALASGTTKALTFDFGATNNPVLTITVGGEGLIVAAGTAKGNTGETISVPVTLTNVAKVGNVGTFNLYAGFDTKLLQATSVTVGDIVVNAPVNFSTQISADGTVSMVFLDNTIGSELITKDGTLATITFKVLGTTKVTTPITLTAGGFGDGKMQRITKLELVNGSVAIDPIPVPSITPTTNSMVQGSATSDLTVTLNPNGKTFNGITGLTQGTDYTVSGTTVTIAKSYLNGLAVGTKALTFDFGVASNPVLTITVNPPVPKLVVAAGTTTGATGETITVPVTFAGVASVGNVGTFNLYAGYDTKLLQAVSVKAGDIVVNAPVNFSTQISADGSVSMVFLDNTIGSELITKDGTLATITFKVLGTSKVTTPITLTAGGFGDGKMQRITALELANGSVAIDPIPVPSITPTTNSMVQGAATSDLSVALTLSGKTFNGITGLTQGTDYTVSGTTVTIAKSYLNGLAVGTKALTFDFGVTNNPVLTITVAPFVGTPSITPTTSVFDQGKASNLPVVLNPNGNTFKGITGLTQGTDYTVSGNNVTIAQSYLNTLAAGTKNLTFDFGVTNNPVLALTINIVDTKLNVTAANVSGKVGDTITVPITFKNVANVGNVGTFNLYVGYDTSLLEATSVKAGDIVVNAPVNLSSMISKTDGSISLVFLDNTIGSELITTDGTLATITFTVKGTSSTQAPITLTAGGFGDGKMKRITELKLNNGSVALN